MPNYLNNLEEDFNDITSDEAKAIRNNGVVFEAHSDAYDFIKYSLGMDDEEFEAFKTSDGFNDEWKSFCEAETQFVSNLK
jgi:hypothetical protein